MGFKQILVTLDGSELAEAALRCALQAAEVGANIHLLSVMEEDWAATLAVAGVMGDPIPLTADPRRAYDPRAIHVQHEYLKRVAEHYDRPNVVFSQQVEPGAVVETILSVARTREVDLIVMATHGRTGLTRTILGSVVSDVLPKAPCPVLVVRPKG
ncbi:MAG: universal stress protein [Anaerolineae bacterium]|jgi:nucleotide-binding universal stress UspA family protein|nr:universal stress protein [Anaerolineae bacterium]